mgnify:CR=1 FL=1
MHSYFRAIGFSKLKNKIEQNTLIKTVLKKSAERTEIEIGSDTRLIQVNHNIGKGFGLTVIAEADSNGTVMVDNSFPYCNGNFFTIQSDIEIEGHTDTEAYSGVSDDFTLGITLIYKLQNVVDYVRTIWLNNYFKKPKMAQLMDAPGSQDKLFTVFGELIICLWNPRDSSPLYPYIFKENLGKMNSLFQGPMPNDAKDLLTFILMQLHEELNHPNNINNNFNQMNIPNANMQKDQKVMFNIFIKDFQNKNRSIISDLFFGLNYNRTECLFCRSALYNYQTFNFLIFPLAEVLNYKNKFVNNMNYYGNTVTLDECFQYNQSYSPLNEYYCNICNRNSQGQYATFLSVLPNIIIIILNRGVGLQYNVKIDFEENLNLQNYVEYFREDSFYELIGLVTHYGESGASGHFIARCKSPIDGFWYLYNDAIIKKIGYFTKEEFHQGNPYILFYKKTKFG